MINIEEQIEQMFEPHIGKMLGGNTRRKLFSAIIRLFYEALAEQQVQDAFDRVNENGRKVIFPLDFDSELGFMLPKTFNGD